MPAYMSWRSDSSRLAFTSGGSRGIEPIPETIASLNYCQSKVISYVEIMRAEVNIRLWESEAAGRSEIRGRCHFVDVSAMLDQKFAHFGLHCGVLDRVE